MNLHEYYHYLQQLPQQAVAMLQTRNTQQNTTKRNNVYKKKLNRKTFSRKPKP
ncbi:hypothetical protein [Polluticoccus soli]|uniref:hypothetical protein n=1 Tax=Polluticoccus soli TaxID=3034150 RepID=UPI0023E2915D|nr:hypothetical protein [Flavipsychrobacter sp. JY13-12]